MVGHTGFIEAAIKAVETVDECVGRVINKLNETGGLGIITADHGNAEEMIDCIEHCPMTAHSMSKVPFVICSTDIKKLKGQANGKECSDGQFGRLCDIAPTILELLKIEKPKEMTGQSLII